MRQTAAEDLFSRPPWSMASTSGRELPDAKSAGGCQRRGLISQSFLTGPNLLGPIDFLHQMPVDLRGSFKDFMQSRRMTSLETYQEDKLELKFGHGKLTFLPGPMGDARLWAWKKYCNRVNHGFL